MELRDYQSIAIDRLKEALKQGAKRPVVQAPTGAGKTVIAAAIVNMARQKDKRVLFCVPALSLIDQTVERFRANSIFDIAVMQGQHELTDYKQPVQVCSVQTLARRKIPQADLVIVDECFSAGTMVLTPDGEKPIETFTPGDRILCATGEGNVISVSRKMSKTMTLRFSNGRSVRVTPEHPFFTGAGWIKAQDLGVGQNVFSEEGLRSLWGRNDTKGISQRPAGSGTHLEQARVLLDLLCQEACQPDEQKCNSFKNARHLIEDQARSYFSRRERSSLAIATIGASSCFGRRLAVRDSNSNENGERFRLSDMLQTGHSQHGDEVGSRDRRWKPLWTTKDFGSKKDRFLGDIRLESITIDERASDEPVFNLHVAGHPSYFAEGVLVHNCHVMFKLYDTWMNDPAWKDVPFIGLTATPWAKGMGASGRWDRLIIGTTTEELIERKHLSDFKCYAPAHPDLSGVKTVLGDYEAKGLGEAMDKGHLVADIVSTWLERGEGRSTICFAVNRVHAKHIEMQFKEAGVAVEYMDAFTDLEDRTAIVERFGNGETKVICNVGVLTTGFDADVRCIILARPTKSEILYTQMIGRGLRTANGKDHCLILDHSDTTLRLGFVTDIHKDKLDDGTAKRGNSERPTPKPKECAQCHFLKPPKTVKCPACGFQPTPNSKIESEDGELYELGRGKVMKATSASPVDRQRWYSELLRYADLRGYKSGWASYAFKDKFGSFPEKFLLPSQSIMVSPEVESWIKSRNIRQSKAKSKYGRGA